jgi:hypothetical protein
LRSNRVIKDQCTCMKTVYDTNRWNEGFKDDILNDMMMNAQKFDDFLINITGVCIVYIGSYSPL